ncbi:MAG: uncharacterized protein JWN66_2221 [Sphingomonas bacterium]|uniref:ferritin-like domain-containing protein n=1 Tax=Sphingomonas bacterium TaxID=1895847 RepID=UPI002606B9CB|nr:ferritin-like domain-containing protein [Sphingomonas bacterium]MDB5705105.1 uncharacterized protein [Sphingomonas bacterium]
MHLTHESGALSARASSFVETDIRTVRWIAQAAINVELFTIPLYMTTLYSIEGFHPITGKNNDFYKGRQWPGAKASAFPDVDPSQPGWGNKRAFNIIFSVFIQEMLHLQMAANIATAIGCTPSFTDTALQNPDNGWTCYGPTLTTIPDIVDLRDTSTYTDVKVNVGPLDEDIIQLFLAIEQPQDDAERDIVRNKEKYFPKVPFDGGNPDYDPATAGIMFGSIGYMYQCYRDYLQIRYDDGTCLWDHVFDQNGQQNDLFNSFSFPGHPMREYMGVETTVALTDKHIAFKQALNMMNAITDQGEGATLKARLKLANEAGLLQAVEVRYRSDKDALESDYPSYSDTGAQVPSGDAAARYDNDGEDHFERFKEVRQLMVDGGIVTWDKAGKAGNWTAADLTTAAYDPNDNPYGLPTPDQIATALNNLYAEPVRAQSHTTLSQAVVGSIKGVTTVLDQYWNPGSSAVSFPFPSMSGSGDRMATAWAAMAMTPDLSQGLPAPNTHIVNHTCQGLDLYAEGGPGTNSCALTTVYHTCRGSNLCKGMGGCGFVQPSGGGGNCSSSVRTTPAEPTPGKPQGGGCSAVGVRAKGGLCGTPTPTPGGTTYTAPSDNRCGGFGGCAVPISACQIYPVSGTMEVLQLSAAHGCGKYPPTPIDPPLPFKKGDRVEDIAFQAFTQVAKHIGMKPPATPPPPNDIRLAFPPST